MLIAAGNIFRDMSNLIYNILLGLLIILKVDSRESALLYLARPSNKAIFWTFLYIFVRFCSSITVRPRVLNLV